MRSKLWRLLALFAVFGLLAAACSSSDDGDGDSDASSDGDGEAAGLVLARIMPETGSLAFLGPPQIEGIGLAVEDINAAGGVLGEDVTLLTADEGDQADVVVESANRVLGEGAHAVVGTAASGQNQEILQTLFDEEIPSCSASNTSPAFTDQDNAGFYSRTVPPDEAVSPIIADTVVGDGHTAVVVIARQDDYGEALQGLVVSALEDQGVTVTSVSYDPDAATFDAEVTEALGSGATAGVLISFDEGAAIIAGLIEGGMDPAGLYGADGLFSPSLPGLVDPENDAVIDGMKVIGASGGAAFNERLAALTENNLIYGGQAYDCGIILALAAESVGSTSFTQADVIAVTEGGTVCESFEDCAGLLADGEDIDYDGVSGPLDLTTSGGSADPTFGRYGIGEYQDGGTLVVTSEQDVDVTTLG